MSSCQSCESRPTTYIHTRRDLGDAEYLHEAMYFSDFTCYLPCQGCLIALIAVHGQRDFPRGEGLRRCLRRHLIGQDGKPRSLEIGRGPLEGLERPPHRSLGQAGSRGQLPWRLPWEKEASGQAMGMSLFPILHVNGIC